ncbi:hypothetical protein LSTR_LSTR006807 [Laodelphax striatellus]|uniref:Uncharacterized protein n=1 Tax=Laodelphax striatellus TaxID=195883 RepID=A0A482WSR4_LAOST|nr:hypothetical protein LSTR_LSTR006807 [Laodelphax striatellus]
MNGSEFANHPCFDNTSMEIAKLIITEGADFHSLLSTLPPVSSLSTTDKCQSNPQQCVQEVIRGPRKKRTLETSLSSALFIFVSNRDLSSKLEGLRDNIKIDNKKNEEWKENAIMAMQNIQKYAARTQSALTNKTCQNELRFTLTEYLFQIQSYYTRMRDMVVMSMNNQVSRDLITLADLIGNLLTRDGLTNTIYKVNPHLFDLLSNVFISD